MKTSIYVSLAGEPCMKDHELTKKILVLFEKWSLTEAQACNLLKITSPHELGQLRLGNFNSNSKALAIRIEKLLGIHAYLRLLFPADLDLAY